MNGDDVEAARIRAAVAGHVRQRAWAEAEAVVTAVLGDPGIQRRRAPIEQEETRAGPERRDESKVFQNRHAYAIRTVSVRCSFG